MGYMHSPEPRYAAPDNDHALRSAQMSHRRRTSGSLKSRRKAIEKFDIHCNCKCSLIVSCAIGTEPGCRERRKEGTCGCKPRWLPVCILEPSTKTEIVAEDEIQLRANSVISAARSRYAPNGCHGCKVWQEGKQCNCPRMYMPRCLVTGCEDRRRGRRCECPRTPTEVCAHVLELAERFAHLKAEDAEAASAEWARQQRQADPERYRDLPLAEAGGNMSTREAAIALMMIRFDGGRALRHPDDYGVASRRRRQQEEQRRLEGMAAGFLALLYAMRRKGGRNGHAA